MDTASLRIKFIPLLKDLHKGHSKVYLEIVPEVSATQNLDKIEWTVDENIVEYIIPMTYKIIIKKKSLNKKHHNLTKIYHSCVDLLNSCSFSNIDGHVECQNVARMFSDNILLNKIATNVERCSIILTKGINIRELSNKSLCPKSIEENKTEEENFVATSSETIIGRNNIAVMTSDEGTLTTGSGARITKQVTQKVTNDNYNKFGYDEFKLNEINTKDIAAQNIQDTIKSRLTMSPICSVDTYDYPKKTAVYNKSNAPINIDIQQAFRSQLNGKNTNYQKHLLSSLKMMNSSNYIIKDHRSVDIKNSLLNRVLPEVRVACFVQEMEREILPLKLLLNEIKSKCLYLGLIDSRKETKSNFLLYNNLLMDESQYNNPVFTNSIYYYKPRKSNYARPLKQKHLCQEPQIVVSTHKLPNFDNSATDWRKIGDRKSSDSQISEEIKNQVYCEKCNDRRACGKKIKCHNTVMNQSHNSNRVVYSVVYDYSE